MAGPKETHLKFLGTLFDLLLFGLAVIAVLSSRIPASLDDHTSANTGPPEERFVL